MTRLEKSVELLRNVNRWRLEWHYAPGCKCGCDVLRHAEDALAQHDADARARVNARQLTLWDALRPAQ